MLPSQHVTPRLTAGTYLTVTGVVGILPDR